MRRDIKYSNGRYLKILYDLKMKSVKTNSKILSRFTIVKTILKKDFFVFYRFNSKNESGVLGNIRSIVI